MINRVNWKLYKSYLAYRAEVVQLNEESLRMDETRLRHLLEWADDTPFEFIASVRPTFLDYLQDARKDGRGDTFSPAYHKKVINAAHQFGSWLTVYRSGYKKNFSRWLDTLRAPRKSASEGHNHEAVTLEEVRAMAAAPAHFPWEQRIKAAAIFWFLSGIRVGAFVTLPLTAVNLHERSVKQWPNLGVKTKFGKHETTHLLNIPDLLEAVKDWDSQVRITLPANSYWFAPLDSKTGELAPGYQEIGKNRDMRARTDLKRWLSSVGLPYHSPHKFRHGFAVYALKQAQDMADFKAVSMNLMHNNISTTDGIYSILSQQDLSDRIGSLGSSNGTSQADLATMLRQIASQLENQK